MRKLSRFTILLETRVFSRALPCFVYLKMYSVEKLLRTFKGLRMYVVIHRFFHNTTATTVMMAAAVRIESGIAQCTPLSVGSGVG